MTKPMWITVALVAMALLFAMLASQRSDDDSAVPVESPAMSAEPVSGADMPMAVPSAATATGSPAVADSAPPNVGSPVMAPESSVSSQAVENYDVPGSRSAPAMAPESSVSDVPGSRSAPAASLPPSAQPTGKRTTLSPGDDATAQPPESLDTVSSVSVGLPPEAGSPQVPGLAPESSEVTGAQMLPPEGTSTGVVGPGPGD